MPEPQSRPAPQRKPEFRSDAGIDVEVERSGRPRHRLVTIGDSLTHGFQSGAIFNTDLSYPAIIAHALGWHREFRFPRYPGYGGIPLNIELVVRVLEERFGDRVSGLELPRALFHLRQHLAEAEDWWEKGPGSQPPPGGPIMHNLAVYGWDLRDALARTADSAHEDERTPLGDAIVPLVNNADQIAASRVLHTARDEAGKALTPFEAAERLSREGTHEDADGNGIETLIVFLGANNALGSVLSLTLNWSEDGYDDLKRKAEYNVWRPEHFAAEWKLVVKAVERIKARHVIFGTVPHVTIAPVARGVGGKVAPGSRYFEYYTRPWISDRQFDRLDDEHLTADQARRIDAAIDAYNETIVESVKAARKAGRDWRIVDVAGQLDRLASRRYLDDPLVPKPKWWSPYELPAELARLTPIPDTRFFSSGPEGPERGGLFSLDGVHPTTIGYGLIAQDFIRAMQEAGVEFLHGDGVTPREGEVRVDWNRLIRLDTLISQPPRSLGTNVKLIGWFDEKVDVFERLWAGAG